MFIQSSDEQATIIGLSFGDVINVRKRNGQFAVYVWKGEEGTVLFTSPSIESAKAWYYRLIHALKRQRVLIIDPSNDDEIADPEIKNLRDLAEIAWGIIAKASGGDWNKESAEWRSAAEKWRDRYLADVVDKQLAERRG